MRKFQGNFRILLKYLQYYNLKPLSKIKESIPLNLNLGVLNKATWVLWSGVVMKRVYKSIELSNIMCFRTHHSLQAWWVMWRRIRKPGSNSTYQETKENINASHIIPGRCVFNYRRSFGRGKGGRYGDGEGTVSPHLKLKDLFVSIRYWSLKT